MPAEEGDVRYDRVLESFEDFRDKEIVYGALEAARLFVQRVEPSNRVLQLIVRARDARISELREHYDARAQGWRRNPG